MTHGPVRGLRAELFDTMAGRRVVLVTFAAVADATDPGRFDPAALTGA